VPIGKGFLLSLQSDNLFGDTEYVGVEHYKALISDMRFFHALSNTFLYAAMSIVITISFSLLLAHILRKVYPRFRSAFIFCLMLPGLTPPAVLAFLYLLIFNGPHGILNTLIAAPLGIAMVDWIRDPRVIKFSLMLLTLWRWSGFITLILLSGMEGIPQSYYDLAKAEGANRWQTFRYVTVPMLSHVIAFAAIFLFLDAFVLFEGGYILLGGSGGTLDAGLLLVAYTYLTAFTLGKFGSAAAMGFSVIPLLMITVWILLQSRKRSLIKHKASSLA